MTILIHFANYVVSFYFFLYNIMKIKGSEDVNAYPVGRIRGLTCKK